MINLFKESKLSVFLTIWCVYTIIFFLYMAFEKIVPVYETNYLVVTLSFSTWFFGLCASHFKKQSDILLDHSNLLERKLMEAEGTLPIKKEE